MSDFVHLHCHTEYSLLDGAIRIDDLCTTTKAFNMTAAAITDHGFLYGAVNFYLACQKHGIKPIIGCEVYVADEHTDRTSPIARVRHHLILLARDLTGYHNLVKLVSRSCIDGFYYKPRVDKKLLTQYSQGITALSACLAGEIPRTLLGQNKCITGGGTFDDALQLAKVYKHIYGEHFYLELQSNGLAEQVLLNDKLCELAKATNIPLVASNDCHYLKASDVEAHDVLLCIQTKAKVHDEKRMRFETRELYLKSPEEMAQAFGHIPEAIENTRRIADSCTVKLNLGSHIFPVYDLPENMTLEKAFQDMARTGLQRRIDAHPNKESLDTAIYTARLELELEIICSMGFPGYFLIVQDFINWAKDNKIPVGPGRGSAAGSLVAWALRITNIDPIPYNLLFERFLNSERVSLPDIDVDFCEEKRTEVIKYVSQKYGCDSVAQITTFGKMKAKAVVRDVGRALDIPYAEVDKIAKLIPNDLKMTLRKALDTEPSLTKLYDTDSTVRHLIDISMRLEGLSRHASVHAAGVVISDTAMDDYLPIYKGKNEGDSVVTQYDMKIVEKVGLVKFDFLGLRTMTLIHSTLKNIKDAGQTPPDLDTLPLTDSKTYDLLSKGNTDGVFQLESAGMRDYLCKLRPTCFEDIIAMLALYRPGPLNSGMVDEFIKRKHGELEIRYPLPQLETCLKDTYGVIVYQEQVMQIAQIVGQYSLGNADLLRRAMGKKDMEEMARERSNFMEGALASNIPHATAKDIFDLMEKFAEYGFNKSHSAAYALITYHTAYLKTNYPLAFMAALFTSESGNQDKILKYIASCKDMHITIQKPDIHRSRREFTMYDGAIVFGLGGIKNVGDEAIKEIISAREVGGPFTSLLDLCSRVSSRKMTKRVLESLIKSGACDVFDCTRASMLAAIDSVVARAQKALKDKQSNQISLLSLGAVQKSAVRGGLGFDTPEQQIPEWDEAQQLLFEKEALGFFLTSHPLQPYRQDCARLYLSNLEDAHTFGHKSTIRVAVLVTSKKEYLPKNKPRPGRSGGRMAFIGIEDLTASGEVTFFSDVYETSQALLDSDKPLLLTATVTNNEQGQYDDAVERNNEDDSDDSPKREIKLLAVSVQSLEDAVVASDIPIQIDLSMHSLETSTFLSIQDICAKHPGQTEVHLLATIDDTPCLFALGAKYRVRVGVALRQDLRIFLKPTK